MEFGVSVVAFDRGRVATMVLRYCWSLGRPGGRRCTFKQIGSNYRSALFL